MNRLFKIVFLIYFLFRGSASPQELLIDSYNTHDGLLQSSVADIIQDDNGMIWLFTEIGISAFDGINFINYTDSVDLFNSWTEIASADTSGNIYFKNLKNQVWRWDKEKFIRIKLPFDNSGIAMNTTADGDLILGSDNAGVFILKEKVWTNITVHDGLYSNTIHSISKTDDGTLFIATANGLNRIENDQLTKVFAYSNVIVQKVLLDTKGAYWLGTDTGLFVHKNRLQRKGNDNIYLVKDLCEDKFNNLWIGAGSGLFRLSPNGVQETVIPTSDFRSLCYDKEGIIWAGTVGKGVYKIRYNPFTAITDADGFPLRMTFPIHQDSNGDILVGTDHGMVKFADSKWNVIDQLTNKRIISVFEDSDGGIWISTLNEIYKIEKNNLRLICDNQTLPGSKRTISQNAEGDIFIITSGNGLWIYENNSFQRPVYHTRLNNILLYTSFADSQRNIWLGTHNSGLLKISGNEIKQFGKAEGIDAEYVFQITENTEGLIWASTSNGVYVIHNDKVVKSYNTSDGLASKTCYSVITHGNIAFVGTSDGLNLIDGESIELFTTADGILNNDCNTNSFMIDDESNLWIGTIDGIAKINLNDQEMRKSNIGSVITNLKSELQEIDLLASIDKNYKKHFVFEPGDNNLVFTCAGLYYSQPSSISYTYFLKTGNEINIKKSNENYFEVEDLKPGEYEFFADAKSPAGQPIRSVNKVSFIIQPFFYQTSAFYIVLFCILFLAAILLIVMRKINTKKKLAGKYKTSSLTKENYISVQKKIIRAVEVEKLYRDPELTLPKLSAHLDIHKEHISQVINNDYKKNFNEFINSYRIEEAKVLLANNNQKINILNIAHEVGFNSKTTFNMTFKKLTGMTPTEYKYSRDNT